MGFLCLAYLDLRTDAAGAARKACSSEIVFGALVGAAAAAGFGAAGAEKTGTRQSLL